MVSVAFVSGVIELLLVIFKITMVVDLISAPIIFGFCSGAGLSIMCGQLATLLGIKLASSQGAPYLVLIRTLQRLSETTIDATIGFGTIMFLFLWRRASLYLTSKGYKWGGVF